MSLASTSAALDPGSGGIFAHSLPELVEAFRLGRSALAPAVDDKKVAACKSSELTFIELAEFMRLPTIRWKAT